MIVDAEVKLEDTLQSRTSHLPREWLLEENEESKSSLEEAGYQVYKSMPESLISFHVPGQCVPHRDGSSELMYYNGGFKRGHVRATM